MSFLFFPNNWMNCCRTYPRPTPATYPNGAGILRSKPWTLFSIKFISIDIETIKNTTFQWTQYKIHSSYPLQRALKKKKITERTIQAGNIFVLILVIIVFLWNKLLIKFVNWVMDSIQVSIKIRPLIQREKDSKLTSLWSVSNGNTIKSNNKEHELSFGKYKMSENKIIFVYFCSLCVF